MHRYVRIALPLFLDASVVVALMLVGEAMEDAEYGNVSLMYLIAIAAVCSFAYAGYNSFIKKAERRRAESLVAAHLACALCVAMFFIGRLYDSRVLFEVFPQLQTLGEYAPLMLLVLAAFVALAVFVFTRVYNTMVKRDASATGNISAVSSTAERETSLKNERGESAEAPSGDAVGRDHVRSIRKSDSPADSAQGEVPRKERFWMGFGALLLTALVLAISIWMCTSSENLFKLGAGTPMVSSQSFLDFTVMPIATIVAVAISIVVALFILVGVVVVVVKGIARLLSVPRRKSKVPDGSVIALASAVVFLGVLALLRLSGANSGIEGLVEQVMKQELVVKVVFAAILLLGSAISVLLIYTVLSYAWVHSNSLLPVAQAIANALVYYVALLFAQVLKYLFFFPDFLSVLVAGIPDEAEEKEG